MGFREADLEDRPFSVKYGRPKVDLPMDVIMELYSKGYHYREIVVELAKIGIKTSKDTVNRRIKSYS